MKMRHFELKRSAYTAIAKRASAPAVTAVGHAAFGIGILAARTFTSDHGD